ncbi:MAG: M56 family metallopeptidase [Verrucomicrobiales bacterium]
MIDEELLLTLLLRGGLVLITAVIVSAIFLRRTQASTLRWMWTCLFVLLFVLPLSLRWQAWQLSVPQSDLAEAGIAQSPAQEGSTPSIELDPFAGLETESPSEVEAEAPAADPVITPPPTPSSPASSKELRWWSVLWLAGSVSVVFFISSGHLLLWWLCRRRRPAGETWQRDAELIAEDFQLRRTPRVYSLAKIRVPTTAGIFRPKILLPPAAEAFTPAQRRATLVHEMTHVRGRDPLFTLLAHLVLAVHWCNPFAWLGLCALRQAQERHCDDAVIASGSGASDYADILVSIASGGGNRFPAAAGIALAMAKRFSLHHRIQLILDRTMRRKKLTQLQKFTLGCVVIGLAAPLALTGIGPASAGAAPAGEAAASSLQKRLGEIKIEKIDFTEATLEEGSDYLRRVIAEKGHEPVNIVVLSSVMGADLHRGVKEQAQIDQLRARMDEAADKMRIIEKEYGVILGRDSLMRELSKSRAALEASRTELEIMESMSLVEIAISHPEAEFVRSALEKFMASEGGPEEVRKRAYVELEERCREYLAVLEKRLRGMQKAHARLEEEVTQSRTGESAYQEAEDQYRDAQAEIKRLAAQKSEIAEGADLVTLQLQNISLSSALKYIAQQAGVELSIEPEAVVFGKRSDFSENRSDRQPEAGGASVGEDQSDDERLAAGTDPTDPNTPDQLEGDPPDVYLKGYLMIQEAKELLSNGKRDAAQKKYREAQSQFSALRKYSPGFEKEMVEFRLRKITEQMEKIAKPEPAVNF